MTGLESLSQSRKFAITLAVFIVISLFSFSILRISTYLYYEPFPQSSLIYFMASVIIFSIFVLIIGRFMKAYSRDIYTKSIPKLNLLLNLLIYGNYISILLFGILTVQILLFDFYYLSIVKIILYVTIAETMIFIGILCYKFASWSWSIRPKKNSVITWLYTCSMSVILLNSFFSAALVSISFEQYREQIKPHESDFIAFVPSSDFVKNAFFVTLMFAYVVFWSATVFMLSKYRSKIGKIKFWIISALPLFYFLLPFYPGLMDTLFGLFNTGTILFAISYTVIFSNNIPIAALFFGLAFWSIRKTVENVQIKNYMQISGYGIVLFFISNQSALLLNAPFPPTALPYIAVMGLASYFLLLGIFSSSISFAQDHILRKKIQQTVEDESFFIINIGNPELEKQMTKKLEIISKEVSKELESQSGIKMSLEGNELQNYISQVINEIKQTKQ